MADSNQSMGDLFRQRRSAAASNRNPSTQLSSLGSASASASSGAASGNTIPFQSSPSGGGGGRKSFAEIQREQEQQQARQTQQQRSAPMGQTQQRNANAPMDGYGRLIRPSSSGGGMNEQRSSGGGAMMGGGNRFSGGGVGRDSSTRGGGRNNRGDSSHTDNSRRGGRGGGRYQQQQADPRASLPIEQGVVHTLLDKFGFILCADRPTELFFHYSEFRDGHSDDLNIGDEVEFKIGKSEDRRRGGGGSGGGGGGEDKLSAFGVKRLPEGTIHWEKEDEPVGKKWRGVVEQVAKEDRNPRGGGAGRDRGGRSGGSGSGASGGGVVEGMIRIANDVKDGTTSGETSTDEKLEVFFAPSDYKSKTPGHSRLDRKDVIEFTLVTERRTGKKYARSISLVQSERERQREEREAKLLEGAPLEQGKVVSNRGDFGFLKSTTRVEEVYFHLSHFLLDDESNSGDKVGLRGLKEGQELEFYVVNESGGGTGGGGGRGGGGKKDGKSVSARKIRLLPPGTVKFEHTLAQGVTGIVTECPVAAGTDPFGRRDDRKGSSAGGSAPTVGKIRLDQALTSTEGTLINEILLHPDLYPGGTFAISRTGSEVGTWIRPGDVLLFDVIQKVVDGTCIAAPTKFGQSALHRPEGVTADAKASVRLVEPSLCGRAQGVIRSIHDNYGFIHHAERNVDVYFPLFEVFPTEIQNDLGRNDPAVYKDDNDLVQNKGGRINVEAGMVVSFDLSLQMLTNAPASDRGRGGGRHRQTNRPAQEKESLRGRRVQILPKGAVKEKIVLGAGVKATVSKEDPKQPFIGTVELTEPLKVDTNSLRSPILAKLVDTVASGKYGDEILFHDVLGDRDAQVVISAVNARDDLEWRYVPESAKEDPHSRKLCIAMKKSDDAAGEASELGGENSAAEAPAVEAPITSESVDASAAEGETAEENDKSEKPDASSKKEEFNKKKVKKAKVVKLIRFDKLSFPDLSIGPVGVGDVVSCDIILSRRSGAIMVENIEVVERKERPAAPVVSDTEDGKENSSSERKGLRGFVTEVVPSRQFGFITAVDEQGSKTGEHIFFHYREVESNGGDGAQDGGRRKKSRGRSASVDLNVRKGDEVTFDAGPGKNGKLNATHISILPRGTLQIPAMAEKSSSCTGYIIMEPSHTSLANTPSHISMKGGPAAAGAGGRWANVKDDLSASRQSGSNVKAEGVILLISDPSHLFSPKPKTGSPVKKDLLGEGSSDVATENKAAAADSATESNTGIDTNNGEAETKDADNAASSGLGIHLRYKLSSMAVRSVAMGSSRGEPKRGDLVSFGKTRGAKLIKDIRIEKAAAATSVRGSLVDINKDDETAVFVIADDDTRYDINLTEIVSCHNSLLKDNEQVDGILHEGKIFGGKLSVEANDFDLLLALSHH